MPGAQRDSAEKQWVSAGKDPTKVAYGAQQANPLASQTLPSALPRGMPAGVR